MDKEFVIYEIKECTKHSCPTYERFTISQCQGCMGDGKYVDYSSGQRAVPLRSLEVGSGMHVLLEDGVFRVIS